jgi:hypothetical protein
MVNCLVSTKIHVQNQNTSRILHPLFCKVFGYADIGKLTAKLNVSPHLGRKKYCHQLNPSGHSVAREAAELAEPV